MYGMDVERLAPARRLVADWIMAVSNPRSRFNEYAKVAAKPYELHRLLMEASARLLRDGHEPPDISGIAPTLLSGGPDGWRWRAQLFFEVVADLVAKKAEIGRRSEDEDDNDDEPDDAIQFDPYEEEVYA
jgi:CRISPR-associated protein Cst1